MPCLFGMKQLCILMAIALLFNWPHIPSLDPSAFLHLKETHLKVSRVVFFFFFAATLNWPPTLRLRHLAASQSARSDRSTLQGEQVETRISSGKRETRATTGGKVDVYESVYLKEIGSKASAVRLSFSGSPRSVWTRRPEPDHTISTKQNVKRLCFEIYGTHFERT